MKKFSFYSIVIISCMFAFSGCKQIREQKAREQFVQDSIVAAQKRKIFVADSLKNARLDSLSIYAWGNIKFGISQSELKKDPYFKKGWGKLENGNGWLSADLPSCYGETFGLKYYATGSLQAKFIDNQLSRINYSFESTRYSFQIENTVLMQKFLIDKFSVPTSASDNLSKAAFSDNDQWSEYARWDLRDKQVAIMLSKNYMGFYTTTVTIYNKKIVHKVTQEEIDKKEREKLEKEQKHQEALQSAF